MSKISIATEDGSLVLTGAGISAESGFLTFRASDWLWAGNASRCMHAGGLGANPWRVWEFYSARRERAQRPANPAHVALAELERRLGERFFLCTQNVDDLHERAGSGGCCICTASCPRRTAKTNCGRAPVEDRAIYRSLDEVGRCLAADGCAAHRSSARCRWRWIASGRNPEGNADGGCRHVRFGLIRRPTLSIGAAERGAHRIRRP